MATHINRRNYLGDRESYYRAQRVDSTGHTLLVKGDTDEAAESLADSRLSLREAFLKLPLLEQLGILTRDKYMSPRAVQDSVKLIAQILMEKEQ